MSAPSSRTTGSQHAGSGPWEHPEVARLERFMRGDLPRPEARLVVRHLLTRCPLCVAVTGRLWELGEQPRVGASQGATKVMHGGTPQ